MSKSLESNQLQELAEATFKQFPKENVVYVASDGNVFLKANKSDALNHVHQNEGVEFTRFDRPGAATKNVVEEFIKSVQGVKSAFRTVDPDQDTDFRGKAIDLGKATATDVVNAILNETKINADNKALAPDDTDADLPPAGDITGSEEQTTGTPAEGDQISGAATAQNGEQLTLTPVAPIVDPAKAEGKAKKASSKKSSTTKTTAE